MAIIDWPTTRPFQGARLELDLAVSRAGFAGYYTGNRQTISHLADRRTATLTLPPCKGADGPARQAFLHGLLSRGDWLRMGVPHQPFPRGTLRGSPTVSASVAAGARALQLAGALSGGNLIRCGAFDAVGAAPGLAAGWLLYEGFGGVEIVAGNGSATAQRVAVASLPSPAAAAGLRLQDDLAVTAGQTYCFSADVRGSANGAANIYLTMVWLTSEGVPLPSSSVSRVMSSAWNRASLVSVCPAGAQFLRVFVLMTEAPVSGVPVSMDVDNVFVCLGVDSAYPGLPSLLAGDWLSIGGNLLQVDYPGATLNDAGAGTVPLVSPLQRPIAAGAAVTWANPAGLWELDADSLPLNFNPGTVADGVALPLREVFA